MSHRHTLHGNIDHVIFVYEQLDLVPSLTDIFYYAKVTPQYLSLLLLLLCIRAINDNRIRTRDPCRLRGYRFQHHIATGRSYSHHLLRWLSGGFGWLDGFEGTLLMGAGCCVSCDGNAFGCDQLHATVRQFD